MRTLIAVSVDGIIRTLTGIESLPYFYFVFVSFGLHQEVKVTLGIVS